MRLTLPKGVADVVWFDVGCSTLVVKAMPSNVV
jgi:hypothetical protein